MSEPEPSRPGSLLRAEREAMGVTVREVAETLNLSMAVIEAIEADDHARLPGAVFARGYVRAYARLLELDPQPLLAQYPRSEESLPPPGASAEAPVLAWIRGRPELVLGGAALLLLALLVLLATWIWPDGEDEAVTPEEPAAESAPGALTAPRPLPLDEAAVESPSDSTDPPAAEPESAARSTREPGAGGVAAPGISGGSRSGSGLEEPGTPPEAAREDAAAADEALPAAVPGETVRRITASGEDRLTLRFTDDCWVEVRDAAGASLYSNLSRGGTRLVLIGQAPFRILLGYAPGVRLDFNGEDVQLAPHTRDNVATLVLGQ